MPVAVYLAGPISSVADFVGARSVLIRDWIRATSCRVATSNAELLFQNGPSVA